MNRTRSILRRIVLFLAAAIGLFAAFVIVEHLRGARALKRHLAELQGNGAKLDVNELLPPKSAPDANALAALLALSNRVSQVHSNIGLWPPAGRLTSNGHALAISRLNDWSQGKESNSWTRVNNAFDGQQELFTAITAALQRPGWDDGFNYGRGFINFEGPPLVQVKQTARVLHIATLHALRNGDRDGAINRLGCLLSLVQRQDHSPLIISQLVRIATAAYAWSATWETLQSGPFSENQLLSLQSIWQQTDLPKDMTRALEMERAMTLTQYQLLGASRETLLTVVKQSEQMHEIIDEIVGPPTRGAWLYYLHVPLWRAAWFEQDQLHELNRWQSIIDTDQALRRSSWMAMRERFDSQIATKQKWFESSGTPELKWSTYDGWRFLLSGEQFGIGPEVLMKAQNSQIHAHLAITAIALERYHLKHGRPPTELTALVPEFLRAVPLDNADGKPLRYRLQPNGTFLLYSLGENFQDDGGDPTPLNPDRIYNDIWNGKDAVWPTPATAAEATAAAHRR